MVDGRRLHLCLHHCAARWNERRQANRRAGRLPAERGRSRAFGLASRAVSGTVCTNAVLDGGASSPTSAASSGRGRRAGGWRSPMPGAERTVERKTWEQPTRENCP